MKKTLLILSVFISSAAFAAQPLDDVSSIKTNKGDQTAINVFDNVFSFNMPYGFSPAYEHKFQEGYVFDAAPEGQSIESWEKLITVTGQQNLATVPGITLNKMMDLYSKGLKELCPKSFSMVDVESIGAGEYPSKAAILRCGNVKNKDGKILSHTMVLNIIKGAEDVYTLRYIEKASAKKKLDAVDVNYFIEKNNLLAPISICKGGQDADFSQKECLKKASSSVF